MSCFVWSMAVPAPFFTSQNGRAAGKQEVCSILILTMSAGEIIPV
jgi:hypothetical protein